MGFTADGQIPGLAKQGSTLVFKNVVTNKDNCYDAASGVFTAPAPGLYTFTASVGAAKAGETVGAAIGGDAGGYVGLGGSDTSTGSATRTFRLQAGGRVRVGTSYSADMFYGSSSFSGALIAPEL